MFVVLFLSRILDKMAFRLMFSRGAVSAVALSAHKMFSRFNLDSNCRGTAFPKHGKAMQWEVGVNKLTANRTSVLASKPQLREKTGNLA